MFEAHTAPDLALPQAGRPSDCAGPKHQISTGTILGFFRSSFGAHRAVAGRGPRSRGIHLGTGNASIPALHAGQRATLSAFVFAALPHVSVVVVDQRKAIPGHRPEA